MIRKGEVADAPHVARLHVEHINQGFLSSLGVGFLTVLYEYLARHEILFVSLEGDRVTGFLSASENTSGMMKRFVIKKFPQVLPRLGLLIISPRFIRKVMETLLAPGKTESSTGTDAHLPELLSIVILPEYRGGTLSGDLLAALETTLRNAGHDAYSVVAGASLAAANAYYRKQGFEQTGTIAIHGGETSNVYRKSLG